ncbi:MAG: hypothetical protein COA57_13730 [Flavobacteriales bacterium]|nr:MAG: hypothetical protein COA57_13730 [Flavobacteriales bacterium]
MLTSGDHKIDSLKKVIETADHDTTKVKTLNALSDALWKKGEYKDAMQYAKECLKLAEELNYKKGQANILNIIGIIHYVQSDYPKALEYFGKSLKIREELGDKEGMAGSFGNIGIIYHNQSDYPRALDLYFRSLKIQEELGDKKAMATSYNNIGVIYDYQSDYPRALDYYFKSLKIREQLGDKKAMATSYNNIGVIYHHQSDYPRALDYYFKSLKIREQLGDKKMATSYNNIGVIYDNQSDYPRALEYYFKALKIREELGDKQGMAGSYTNIGVLYTALYKQSDSLQEAGGRATGNQTHLDSALHYHNLALVIEQELSDEHTMSITLSGIGSVYSLKQQYHKAIENYQQAAMLADSIGALNEGSEAHSGLAEAYDKLGNHKLALEHYKQYSTLKDSTFNEEKSKDLGKLEAKHEMQMAEADRKRKEEEQARISAGHTQRRNLLQYSGILIFIVAFFITLLFSGRLNIPVRLAEGGVFFTFLLVFEFLLVLTDPNIEQYTGGEPAYKLIINAGLAGLIFPLHSIAESKLKQRLFKTKKKIIAGRQAGGGPKRKY